jgi:hypothetical protein
MATNVKKDVEQPYMVVYKVTNEQQPSSEFFGGIKCRRI